MRRPLAPLGLISLLALFGCGGPEGDLESAHPAPEAAGPDRPTGITPDGRAAAEAPPGRWRRQRAGNERTELSEEQLEQIERLESIGYVAGSTAAPAAENIVLHARGRAYPGLNFYTSGHAPEAVLIDMEGRVLHRWRSSFERSLPDAAGRKQKPDAGFWRRAYLFENGEILALHEGLGIVRLDRDSRRVWSRAYPVHHDLHVAADGRIFVLTREAHLVPSVSRKMPVLEDYVSILDPASGEEQARISLLECFENSPQHDWRAAARAFWQRERTRRLADNPGDLFHTNSLEHLDGRIAERAPPFRAGSFLISLCHLDMIAVVDLERRRIDWTLGGIFGLPHDPTVAVDGTILVFDNNWQPGRSRVVALDPVRGEAVWEYRGTERRPFFSRTCGTAASLPNGNVLVTESDAGRAFEVTSAGEIVWEFYNPHRAGERGELIATLFEVVRLPADFPTDWAR